MVRRHGTWGLLTRPVPACCGRSAATADGQAHRAADLLRQPVVALPQRIVAGFVPPLYRLAVREVSPR
jgi:hypothetical protein